MAITTQAQPQFIVDTEAERDLNWPDGSFIYCKDTYKTYILCAGSFKTVSGSAGTGAAAWGDITGTLSAQTDLQTALNLKSPLVSPIFTTPNIGDATATSITIGTTSVTGNLIVGGVASVTGNIIGGATLTIGTISATGNCIAAGTASFGGAIIGGTTITVGTVSATGAGIFGGALSFSTAQTMIGERAYITFEWTSAALTLYKAVPFNGKVIDCWTTAETTPRTCSGFTLAAGSAGTIYCATVALAFATAIGQQRQPSLTPNAITTASAIRVTVTTAGTACNFRATVVIQRTA